MPRQQILLIGLLVALAGPSVQRVWAIMNDSESVGGNTFTTANPFRGVRVVQSGTVTSSGIGLVTDTLPNAVDMDHAFLIFSSRHNSPDSPDSLVRGRLASPTTVEFGRLTTNTTDIEIRYYVIEYFSGVNVQRGETFQTATVVDETLPVAVSDVSQAFVTWSKTPAAADTGWDGDDPIVAELTSTSNLQFRAEVANATHRIWWQVIEFTDPADILVQTGSTSLLGGSTFVDVALGSGVDLAKAFILLGYRSSGSGIDIGSRMPQGYFLDGNNIRIERQLSGTPDDLTEIVWQVIELNDGSVVRSGNRILGSAITDDSFFITAVDASRSAAFASVQSGSGQNMGGSNYGGDSVPGVGAATFSFDANNILNIRRDNAAAKGYYSWFAVEFADL